MSVQDINMRLYAVSIRFTNNDFHHIIGNFALDSCSFCSKFNFLQSLTMQDKQVESCPNCAKTFSSRTKMKIHQKQVWLDELETDVVEQAPSCVAFVDALRDLKSVHV